MSGVAWISKNDFIRFEIPKYRETELCLYFETPIEFTAKNLAKMNGIVNGKSGALLAVSDGDGVVIWGICYFAHPLKTLNEIPAGIPCARHFSPDCPMVTISGVGRLEITRGSSRLGLIENGAYLPSHVDIITYSIVGKYILKKFGIETNGKSYRNNTEANIARTHLSCIRYMVEVLAQRKQGATIIIVPNKETTSGLFDTAWGITGNIEISILQQQKIKYEEEKFSGMLSHLKVSETLRNRLRSLVDLSKMDGALLITHDLNVIGFGVKLKAPKWSGNVCQGEIPYCICNQPLEFSRLGTRHNSALDFVGKVEGAIAFVSSSDGPIRVMTKDVDCERIIYWPDCRESKFKK